MSKYDAKPPEKFSQRPSNRMRPTTTEPAEGYVKLSNAVRAIWYLSAKGYHVKEDGTVVSYTGKTLKTNTMAREGARPFLRFAARNSAKKVNTVLVHRLAAYQKFGDEAFYGCNVVRHLDGNTLNNALDNIAIWTRVEQRAAMPEATRWVATKNAERARRRITFEQAQQLRQDKLAGLLHRELAAKYGVGMATVSEIVNNKTYVEGLP